MVIKTQQLEAAWSSVCLGAFSHEDCELIARSHEKLLGPLPLASFQDTRHHVLALLNIWASQ